MNSTVQDNHPRIKSPSDGNVHAMHSPRAARRSGGDSPLRNRRSSPGPILPNSGINKSPERRERRSSPLRRSPSYRTTSPGAGYRNSPSRRSPLRRTSPIRRSPGRRMSPHTRSPPRRSPGNRNPSISPRRPARRSPSPSRGMNKRRRDDTRRDSDRKHVRDDNRRSIYVGNLPYDIRKEELRALCSHYGDVYDVTLGARGFGFVYMDARGARRALTALDKRTFGGRILHVNEAFKEER